MTPPSATAPHEATSVPAALERYYTRYYRDALGIPGWRAHVALRVDDREAERRRLARLEHALDRPVQGLRLLDVACGTGGFAVAAAAAGARVWGVDASGDAVAIAARRAGAAHVVQAAAEALPFAAAAFDVVHCYSTLEHVADARAALREMVRVLHPRGALYVHVPHRWAWTEVHYKVFWIPGLPRWIGRAYLAARGRPTAFLGTLHPPTPRELRRDVEAAGAVVVRLLSAAAPRPTGGPLWPLVRGYYRLTGIAPSIELVARPRHA